MNHQVSFAKAVADRIGTIIVIDDIDKLGETITNYDEIIRGMKNSIKSNNESFNKRLDEIVKEMFEGRKI